MAYLASIHKPSSIRHALTLKFFDQDEECLVVA
jgi:DNA damage-binding protein 1